MIYTRTINRDKFKSPLLWRGLGEVIFIITFLMLSGVNAQVLRKPIPDKLVVLTFDDAILSHATIVAPLLKKYGFGATFFVCEFQSPPFADKTKYMSWGQIQALDKMGFEIGNHTKTHAHVGKLDSAAFVAQLQYIENKCAEYGIKKPITFAYPGYETSPKSFAVLKSQGYIFARAGGGMLYDPNIDHPYLIPGLTTLADNKSAVYEALAAAKDGKIAVLTIHGVPDSAHAWVNTPPELFEEYLKFMKAGHYKVIALRDLKAYIDIDKAQLIKPDYKKVSQK